MTSRTLVALVVGLAACAPEQGPYVGAADVERWSVAPEPSVSIGDVDGPSEQVLSRVASVVLLPEGGVAVADGDSHSVRVYDERGAFVRSFGREGDGPGEFRFLGGMWLRAPDTLDVYDAELARLTRYTTAGVLLPGAPTFRAPDGRVEVYLGRFDDGDHALAWIVQGERGSGPITPDRMRMGRFGPDGTFRALLGTDVGMRRGETDAFSGPTPLSPHFIGVVVGDIVYHGDGLGGALRRTDRAGTGSTPLQSDLSPWDPELARVDLESALDSVQNEWLPDAGSMPGLDSVPRFSDLFVDGERRLWLKRYDPSEDSHWVGRRRTGGDWTVLNTDGEVVAHVAVPTGFRLLDAGDTRVAGLTRDGLGVERVEVRALSR